MGAYVFAAIYHGGDKWVFLQTLMILFLDQAAAPA
jgi:hypothetical protein